MSSSWMSNADLRSAISPLSATRSVEFRTALAGFAGTPRTPRTVAVVGTVPGAGRSTVTALLALAAAAFSDRRVAVIDTVTPPTGPRSVPGRMPAADDAAGRTVTALLGGDVLQGRLPSLIDGAISAGVSSAGVPRRLVRASATPGAPLPVLSLPPGPGGFPPQLLEQALSRLRYRADLVVLDTPVGPQAPVLHAVMGLADHYLLVVRADASMPAQVAAGLRWLATAPGRPRHRPVTVVAVGRGLRARAGLADEADRARIGVAVLPRDEALRRRSLGRMSRRSLVAGLRIATAALSAAGGGVDQLASAPGPAAGTGSRGGWVPGQG